MALLRKELGLLVLIGMVGSFVPTIMLHAAAQTVDPGAMTVGPTIQGEVTQKIAFTQGSWMIMVDGRAYGVSMDFYNKVDVGTVVRYDGHDWTIVQQ